MGKKMAGTNEFAFFCCKSICTGGGLESGRKKFEKCLPAGTKIYFSSLSELLANFSGRFNAEPVGHPQACAYPDVCLCTDTVSGKAPLLAQCIWWMPLLLPLCLKESVGRLGRHFVYLPGPLSQERRFTGHIANP